MSILEAIVLGIVQGLTEFLPVSSSGHLVLLHNVFGVSEPQLFFDTMLHLGTLVAVFIVMWEQIISLFKPPFYKMGYLIVATIPAVIYALLFNDFVERAFTGFLLGYSFLLTALLLTAAEIISARIKKRSELKTGTAAVMGLMQVVGTLPGVSRSGSTIAGGLFCGIDRKQAAAFSFLMSIPAIIGAVLFQGIKLVKEPIIDFQWLPTVIGTVCAAAAGYFAIKFMLALITRKRLYGFAVYVAVLGILVLLDKYILGIISWT